MDWRQQRDERNLAAYREYEKWRAINYENEIQRHGKVIADQADKIGGLAWYALERNAAIESAEEHGGVSRRSDLARSADDMNDEDSDTIADFRAMKELRKEERSKHGVPCPRCKQVRPKAHASILLPQQRCRVDGYVDPRPELP